MTDETWKMNTEDRVRNERGREKKQRGTSCALDFIHEMNENDTYYNTWRQREKVE